MAATKAKERKSTQSVNEVNIRGVIVHMFRANACCIMTLKSSLTRGTPDFPKVYWYDDLADEVMNNFTIGDGVPIKARIQTSRKYRIQYVAGLSIEKTPRELKEKVGIDAGRRLPDKNEVLLAGEFVRSFVPEGKEDLLSLVTLKTNVDGFINFPQITCFGKTIEQVKALKPGDKVCFVGHIETAKKDKEGETKYYQSIVSYFSTPLVKQEVSE